MSSKEPPLVDETYPYPKYLSTNIPFYVFSHSAPKNLKKPTEKDYKEFMEYDEQYGELLEKYFKRQDNSLKFGYAVAPIDGFLFWKYAPKLSIPVGLFGAAFGVLHGFLLHELIFVSARDRYFGKRARENFFVWYANKAQQKTT